jgi:hypothetical protein
VGDMKSACKDKVLFSKMSNIIRVLQSKAQWHAAELECRIVLQYCLSCGNPCGMSYA